MDEERADLVGTTLDERYHVLREIGRGAMGAVYEAQHPIVGRRFAIKVLRRSCSTPAQRERFFHEARAAGTITHPNIVQVQDFGVAPGGAPYLVMEYVDGIDLQHHLEEKGPLPAEEALEISSQMLSALEVIHGAGLVHRDIKPANIMLARGKRIFAKLLDFGIARALNPAWQRRDITTVDQVLGTPAYLSPEQAAGGPVDPRWDLWAMAVILYEMLCAKLPFKLESLEQVTGDILACRLIPLRGRRPDLPGWLYEVMSRAHHPRPERRFKTATAFLQALELQTPRPDGGEEADARTVPFMRVQLQTPPPGLMAELIGEGAGQARPAPPASEPDRTDQRPRAVEPVHAVAAPLPRLQPEPLEPGTDDVDPMENEPTEAPGIKLSGAGPRPTGPMPRTSLEEAGALELVFNAHPPIRRPTGPLPFEAAPATPPPGVAEPTMDVPLPAVPQRRRRHQRGPEPARRLHARQLARRRKHALMIAAGILLLLSTLLLIYLVVTR